MNHTWVTSKNAHSTDRPWPYAIYNNEKRCAVIYCLTPYGEVVARNGEHEELSVRILDHSYKPPKWTLVKQTFRDLSSLQLFVGDTLIKYPKLIPKTNFNAQDQQT